MNLVTIECSRPGDDYSLFVSATNLDVHLAGPGERGGTGAILCGFDRFARNDDGQYRVGFSVGGGVSGPGYNHHPCVECAELINGRPISGTHKNYFPAPSKKEE